MKGLFQTPGLQLEIPSLSQDRGQSSRQCGVRQDLQLHRFPRSLAIRRTSITTGRQ